LSHYAQIVAELERLSEVRTAFLRKNDLELAAAIERLRALGHGDVEKRPDRGLKDLIPAGEAAEIAKRAKPTMNTWCRKHAIDADRGFAIQIGGRWFVSRSRLLLHLASGSSD
jgi:hypothetical protein